LMEQFHNSLPFDKKMIEEDIDGSIAWAHALSKAGVFSEKELSLVVKGLEEILDDYNSGKISFLPGDEDIHMAVERILIERVGETGARLHTGRSRNDQVATDIRLYVKKALERIDFLVVTLQKVLVKRATGDLDIIIPGFTHLQQAQPILLAHYWLSLFFLLEREKKRINNAVINTDIMPLGAGAIAGSGFNVDRTAIARELGFGSVSQNSIDAVGSRDFILETLSVIASIGIHISRYAEDLIIWSSREFGFIELDDAWSTGSSMMPQKKNPDSVELIRGKSGRFLGNYTRFATVLKGVGLTYYKDLQEDKEPVFDSIEQICLVLEVFSRVIETLAVKTENIQKDLDPFLLATDLADYLVRKGMPFRMSHKVIGKIVAYCIETSRQLDMMGLDEFRKFSDLFENDVLELFSWRGAVDRRNIEGGTSKESVLNQIKLAQELVN
ncbi:MAG TPA: argininosuccinate lyase, partial [Chitinispirillaceae bacterium]|nr:argininosuccinate lyase [Chitinispirillaceae bacterium]